MSNGSLMNVSICASAFQGNFHVSEVVTGYEIGIINSNYIKSMSILQVVS